jgi:3-oxoacyl-[acyl-carrier protein] reductase
MTLTGKVALVTGGGSGIGRAIALRLASEGATTIVCDINRAAGEAAAQTIEASGGRSLALALDVSDPAAVAQVYADVERRFGALDIQVSNAGVTTRIPFLRHRSGKLRADPVDQSGRHASVRSGCRTADARQGRPHPQHDVGLRPTGRHRSRRLRRVESGDHQPDPDDDARTRRAQHSCQCLAPGPTKVERTAHGPAQTAAFLARLAIKRYATPDDIAGAALFLVSDQNSYVTGHILNVDGGFGAAGVMYDPAENGQ